jgi:glycosyltransferase involved in cell wall biosynthesis
MRIAIDASRATRSDPTGTERYARDLICALIPLAANHRITLYYRDTPPPGLFPDAPNVTHKIIPLRRLWTHVRLAAALYRERPDVTFVPAHTLPFAFPGRAVVTVHDLGYRRFPQAHPIKDRLYLELTTRYSARRASVVLADSIATAADLTRFYGTRADKVRVAYPGVEAPPVGDVEAVRAKFGLPARYFAFVGTLQPRKNIGRLVEAFAQVRAEFPDVGLALAGGRGWLFDPAWTEGVEGVHLLGYVTDAEKGGLLRGAAGFVFPSLYEGFGFPVLEAMHAGTPVITARTSSLPELTGDHAALLVDPLDVDAIASAMRRLLTDDALRERLVAAGLEQVRRFTWEACAREALAALEEAGR